MKRLKTTEQNYRLKIFLAILFLCFSLSALCEALHIGYPILHYLTMAGRFDDFYGPLSVRNYYDPHSEGIMFPFCIPIYNFLALLPPNVAFAIYIGLFLVIAAVLFWRAGGPLFCAGIFLFCYPFLFAVSRSNPDLYVFLYLTGFFAAYQAHRYILSALLLSVAICIKPPLIVFLTFFLSDLQFQPFMICCISAGLLTLGPVLLMWHHPWTQPWTQLRNLLSILPNYQHSYAWGDGGHLHGHSLFGAIKLVTFWIYDRLGNFDLQTVMQIRSTLVAYYARLSLVLSLSILGGLTLLDMEDWRRFLIAACAATLLPYVSADYRLLYFLIPLMALIQKDALDKGEMRLFILLCLLMVVKQFWWFRFRNFPSSGVTIGSLINPLLILSILIYAFTDLKPKTASPLYLSLRNRLRGLD